MQVTCTHCHTQNEIHQTIVCGNCHNPLMHIDNDTSQPKNYYLYILLPLLSIITYEMVLEDAVFTPRYALIDEYNLMNACVGAFKPTMSKSDIETCECAITNTQKESHKYASISDHLKVKDFDTDIYIESFQNCSVNYHRP